MNKKRLIYFLILVVLILIIFLLEALIMQKNEIKTDTQIKLPVEENRQMEFVENETIETESEELQNFDSNSIPYPSFYNFAQTYNDCGPFNSAAVVRALTGENVASAEFAKTINHRIQYNWTLPEGLAEQLNQYGVLTEMPDLSGLKDEEKIEFLKEQLRQNNPVILLIKKDDFQHYITLFGFDTNKSEFYIYDSLMERSEGGLTKDENGDSPGNKSIFEEKLLEMWSGGGMLGIYEWLAIICSK